MSMNRSVCHEKYRPRLYVLPRYLNDGRRAIAKKKKKRRLVIPRNAVQNRCYPESRTQVQRRIDHKDCEELTRCKMCRGIVFFYSQGEVHRILGSTTTKN